MGRAVEVVEGSGVITPLLPPGAWHPSSSSFWEMHATHANTCVPTDSRSSPAVCRQARSPGTWADVHEDLRSSLTISPPQHPAPHNPCPSPIHPGSQHAVMISDQGVFG